MTAKEDVGTHVLMKMIENRNVMESKIAGYFKTEHFLYRQWDRGVSDLELNFILNRLHEIKGQQLLIVSRKLIKKCSNKKCLDLFIKIEGRTLITCFYCDFQDYLIGRKKENYLLMSQG
jgi:hypothetical protein